MGGGGWLTAPDAAGLISDGLVVAAGAGLLDAALEGGRRGAGLTKSACQT